MASIYRPRHPNGKRSSYYNLKWYDRTAKKYRYEALHYPSGERIANRRDALARRAEKEKELLAGAATASPMSFRQVGAAYLQATAHHRSAPYQEIVQHRLAILNESLGEHLIGSLHPAQVEQALNALAAKRAWGSKARNDYLALARSVSRWCLARDFGIKDFTRGLKRAKQDDAERPWFTKPQWQKLRALARRHPYFPIMATAYYTGLRWKELARLDWEHIDFKRRSIVLPPQATKTKRSRVVPLHPELALVLRPLAAKSGPCFPPGNRNHYAAVLRVVQGWYKAAGIKGKRLGLHAARHSFVSNLLMDRVSIWKVSEWAGHSDVKITKQRYSHRLPAYDADIAGL